MEIKYRSAYKLPKNESGIKDFIHQLVRQEREDALKNIVGNNKKIIKLFITTRVHFGKDDYIQNSFISEINKHGFECNVWYFDDIIPELYKKINEKEHYNTELTQTIRLIKTYLPNTNS